jgi:TolB protein
MFVLLPAIAGAADKFDLEVYASKFDSIPIGIVNFTPTNKNILKDNLPWEIIANNFDICGKFNVITNPVFDSVLFVENNVGIYIDGHYTVDGSQIVIECSLFDVDTRTLIISKKYKGELKFLRSMVHRYSNELVEMLFGDRGIFESRILYVKNEGAKKNIAIMDFDGHNRSMLTNSAIINVFPVFADKSTVLWTSYMRGKPDLYKGSIKDGAAKIFIQGNALTVSPDVSAIDGTVAYASSQTGSLNVYTCAANGSKQRQLTFTSGINTSPNWSPNGYQIAFTSDRGGNPQIYIMDADGANQRRVTYEGRYNDCAAWSPKGDKIAYASIGENYQFKIWTVSTSGSDAQMVADLAGSNENPTWSPDGNLIAFINTRGGRSDLYVVRHDGTRLRRITASGDVKMPRWSGF